MRMFWKYIFPAFFGLIIYASIRLVTDQTIGEAIWTRPWYINAIEILSVIAGGYFFDALLKFYIRKFNKRASTFSKKNVLTEFAELFFPSLFFINVLLFTIHYFIDDPVTWVDFAIANIVVLLYVFLYYSIVRGNHFIKALIEQRTLLEKIKNDQLQTELKFLRAQYHPHFLFNALNTIYFQMDENVSEAKKTVEKFSELLRYQLYDQQQQVPVQQEINYLKNFIQLQQTRTSEKLKLTIDIDNNLNGEKVYPLLFLPLVENAFKYVGGDYQLDIELKKLASEVLFRVSNSVPKEMIKLKEGGIGLENLQRRLALLYPGKYSLHTRSKDNVFCAELKLQIHE